MKNLARLLTCLLFLPATQASPRSTKAPFCNTTAPTPLFLISRCQVAYPIELRIMNSRYPDYDVSPLHAANSFFMLLRQLDNTFKVATQVQFHGLPSNRTNTTCRLEFMVPTPETQRIQGPNPSFNAYQVAREAGANATWNSYEGGDDKKPFGQVNGEEHALDFTRRLGGATLINETICNETMTFHMGMAHDGGDAVNYWDFINVAPPGFPVQGFRMVYGC